MKLWNIIYSALVITMLCICLYTKIVNIAYADTTLPVFSSNTLGFSTPTNVIGNNESLYSTYTSTGQVALGYYAIPSLPSDATVQSFNLEFNTNTSGNGGSATIEMYDGSSQYLGCQWTNYPANIQDNGFLVQMEPGNITNSGGSGAPCASHFFNPSFVNSGNFGWRESNDSASWNSGVVAVSVNYSIPSATAGAVDVEASSSAGTTTMAYSGNTNFTQAGEYCNINVYEVPTGYNGQPNGSQQVASIVADSGDSNTSSIELAQNQYIATGFTSTNSSWSVNPFTIPLFPNTNYQLTQTINCYHTVINSNGSSTNVLDYTAQGLNSTQPDFSPDLISTPSALQNSGSPTIALSTCVQNWLDPGYWVCGLETWLYSTWQYFFAPDELLDTYSYQKASNEILSKAPFAYIIAATNVDFSATGTASGTPTLALDIGDPGNSYVSTNIPRYINWTDSAGNNIVSGYANNFRAIMSIIAWFSFVWYLLSRAKRIFFSL